MTTRKTKYLLWFMMLVMIMACIPGAAAPVVPTIDPNTIGTLIVQTANAALTRTAAAVPTLTPTATITPTRATNTPEPTATSTVIFIFFSPTAVIPATSTVSATSNKAYSCQIMSVTPANGTSFSGRTDFDATWKVRNNGQRNWNKDIVDYAYLNGDRIQKVDTYDLQETIRRGETVDLVVDMTAPKKNGAYTTNWTMRAGTEAFCTMSLTIVVK
jgi:hypothetical protein